MSGREEIMRQWDAVRLKIAGGYAGSGPRDWFEGILDEKDARIAALEEGLKPFAAIAMDGCLSDHPDSYAPRPARGKPNMGDFRLARSLLSGD